MHHSIQRHYGLRALLDLGIASAVERQPGWLDLAVPAQLGAGESALVVRVPTESAARC